MLLKWMKRKICNIIWSEIKTYFVWVFKNVFLPIKFDWGGGGVGRSWGTYRGEGCTPAWEFIVSVCDAVL